MSQRRPNARRRHICLQSPAEGWKRRRRETEGEERRAPIYRHLPNDSRPWQNHPDKIVLSGGGEGGGRDGIAALSIIAGEKLRSLKAPLLSSRVLKFMYSGLLDR